MNLNSLAERQINFHYSTPERLEYVIDHIIKEHLKAYPKTPAVLNLHASEYKAGMKAFEEGLCWARRDSFQNIFLTSQVLISQGLKPGKAMVWENLSAGRSLQADADVSNKPFLLPQRYFDIQAHYIGIGFNPWENIKSHETCDGSLKFIEQNIGYRIRPSLVWHREVFGKDEIVLGLNNDGCSSPPGVLTITARFPDGSNELMVLPAGEPAPGLMKMYSVPLRNKIDSYGQDAKINFSMKIQMRGKILPVQWAVKTEAGLNNFNLEVPLKPKGSMR